MTEKFKHLSGSVNGKQMKVTGDDTAGAIVVHTSVNAANKFDMIHLCAANPDTTAIKLYLEYGSNDPDDLKVYDIAAGEEGQIILCEYLISGGIVLKAYAKEANKLFLIGRVKEIDQSV